MNPAALFKVSYGLYIISSLKDGKTNGQIANTVNQVTAEPAQITIAINKLNLTHDYIRASGVFSASVLSQIVPMKMIGQFGFHSGRDIDKFDGINVKTGLTGAPIVMDYSVAYLEARVVGELDVGTHTLFVGEISDAQIINDHEPLTYAYYHQIKGGKSSKNAPSYIKEEKQAGERHRIHQCTICGYMYDPEKGDPDHGIEPGTPFADLPENWDCPICNADRTKFIKKGETSETYKCKICGYIYDPAKGDPDAGIAAGTSFDDLPDGWKCPVCQAPKTEFEKER